MKLRHALHIALIFSMVLLATGPLFAISSGESFMVSHNVMNIVDAQSYLEFWNPSSNRPINESTFMASGSYDFATLVLYFFGNVTVDISMTLPHLRSNAGFTYPYELYIYNPETTEILVSKNGEPFTGGETVTLATGLNHNSGDIIWHTDELADLRIVLNDTGVPAGTYRGDIIVTLTSSL